MSGAGFIRGGSRVEGQGNSRNGARQIGVYERHEVGYETGGGFVGQARD